MDTVDRNIFPNSDPKVIDSFSAEWSIFPQKRLSKAMKEKIFGDYFGIFPWEKLSSESVGADIGCGTGRWASMVAPRVGSVVCVDPSRKALDLARSNLRSHKNVDFLLASANMLPFEDKSLDFAYSLGVLHHLPNPEAALTAISDKLKPGAPFLMYLYYAFDNRPAWYRRLWRVSDAFRRVISRFPVQPKYISSQVMAILVYWPLARLASFLDKRKMLPSSWPLSYYRDKEFYVIRTDALDRFGTPLEKRFTRKQIAAMMDRAGFVDVKFSETAPHWIVVGTKKESRPT